MAFKKEKGAGMHVHGDLRGFPEHGKVCFPGETGDRGRTTLLELIKLIQKVHL